MITFSTGQSRRFFRGVIRSQYTAASEAPEINTFYKISAKYLNRKIDAKHTDRRIRGDYGV